MRGNSLTPKQISRWNRKSPVKSVTQIEASRNKIRIIKILPETLDYYSNFDPLLNCHRSSRPEKLAIFAQRNGRWKEEITSLPRPWKSSVSTLNRRPSFEIRHVRDNPRSNFLSYVRCNRKHKHRVSYRKTHVNDGLRRWSACQVAHPPKSPWATCHCCTAPVTTLAESVTN